MIDPETSKLGIDALSAAIAEIMEAGQDLVIRPLPAGTEARLHRLGRPRMAGEDIAALAKAMEVLVQRLQPRREPLRA